MVIKQFEGLNYNCGSKYSDSLTKKIRFEASPFLGDFLVVFLQEVYYSEC